MSTLVGELPCRWLSWTLIVCVAAAPAAAVCAPEQPGRAQPRTALIVGDSLSSGYGLRGSAGWVDLLAEHLGRSKCPYRLTNMSRAGQTAEHALDLVEYRLGELRPHLVLLELGGNDALRGVPVDAISASLALLIQRIRQAHAVPIVVAVRLPRSVSRDYRTAFDKMYARLAVEQGVVIARSLFDGLEETPQAVQEDGIHPTAAAQEILARNIANELRDVFSECAPPK